MASLCHRAPAACYGIAPRGCLGHLLLNSSQCITVFLSNHSTPVITQMAMNKSLQSSYKPAVVLTIFLT